MSSSGTAVESPSAKAEATGVTGRGSRVGAGSLNGAEVDVGKAVAGLQAVKTNTREALKPEGEGKFFHGHI